MERMAQGEKVQRLSAIACPFCASLKLSVQSCKETEQKSSGFVHWIYCHQCGASGPCKKCNTVDEAVYWWNSRVPVSAHESIPKGLKK